MNEDNFDKEMRSMELEEQIANQEFRKKHNKVQVFRMKKEIARLEETEKSLDEEIEKSKKELAELSKN